MQNRFAFPGEDAFMLKYEPNTRNLSCSQRFFSIRILEHIFTTIHMKEKKQKERKKKKENKPKSFNIYILIN